MTVTIYRYPLDPTGLSPNNLVVDEEHQLSNRTIRCVAPTYGGFFAEGAIVKDATSNIPLIKGVDYSFGELFEFPTGRYGKEVFGILIIKKTSVTSVKFTYQALGGDYSYSMDAVIEAIDNLNLGERPVAWPDIIGRPTLFNPASHFHDLGDVYGFEYVVHSLERLRTAILTGDVASHDEIYRYIDSWGESLDDLVNALRAEFEAHRDDKENPHNTTKSQVGLGNVENLAIATKLEAEAGSSNLKYMTPLRAAEAIDKQAGVPLRNHINNTSNPHNTTKAQVGLGNVDDFATAARSEAEDGALNSRFMTPLRTKEAIDFQAIAPLNAHIQRTDNPHDVTKAQVGLGAVQNFGLSTNAEAIGGDTLTSYMTPQRVKEAIFQFALTNTNFVDPVAAPSFRASRGIAAANGYSFQNEGSFDTGMYSTKEGELLLRADGSTILNVQPGSVWTVSNRNLEVAGARPMIMGQETTSPGGINIIIPSSSGDANMAGMGFAVTGNYSIRMGLRADGYFGIGGGSRTPWSWYTDPTGNMIAAGDVVAYSDPRLKDDWEMIEDPFALLEAVQGWSFKWKEGIEHTAVKAGKKDFGFNALSVYKYAPELVHSSVQIGDEKYLTVAYEKFAPFFSRGLVILKKENEELRKENTEIKKQLRDQADRLKKLETVFLKFG